MDFFERQDRARRNTKVLIFYFTVAVVLLVVAVYAAVSLIFVGAGLSESVGEPAFHLWQPDLFLYSTLGTILVVLMGSVSKSLELSDGGRAVAEMLDGRLLDSNTTDANERKLLNVVEEMAIASGVPVPQVYVMDGEEGINAFAAGHSQSDAVVSVTGGCMKLLSRDELQGVIGHEFSHILNGDMRLNFRLISLIFGIVCLTVVGRILLQTRGKKNPLPLLGLALIIIGAAGVFFGRLIQAAVSRQREVLADASAVQFTRNPLGLANALKKIGGLAEGSHLQSAHAEEASHLFFADGLGPSFLSLMATHPSLEERIRALDPSFDGTYPEVSAEAPPPPPPFKALPAGGVRIPGFPIPLPGTTAFPSSMIVAQTVLPDVGRPAIRHLRYAEDWRATISPALGFAAREPFSASALMFALLLSKDPTIRQTQINQLIQVTSAASHEESLRLQPEIEGLPVQAKIPLIDLALPALRRLSPPQFHEFRHALQTLAESDQETDLFEYMLQKIVLRHLDPYFLPAAKAATQFYALSGLTDACAIVLSAMAHAGHANFAEAEQAFTQGTRMLNRAAQSTIPFLPEAQCQLPQVDTALSRLSQAVPQIKKNVLNACIQTLTADNVIQEGEAELLRAVADTLDCPIPPFAPEIDGLPTVDQSKAVT